MIGRAGAPFPVRGPSAGPYRPDMVADGWSSDHFDVRCASVRGAGHRYLGEPRQDECAVVPHPSGAVIAVVADGVSGAPLSHLGATMACRTVVDYLSRALDDGATELDWPDLLRCAGWSLVEYASRQLGVGEPDPQAAERLLATTVVVAYVRPDGPGRARGWLARVGDSTAWTLRGVEWTPLFPMDPDSELLPDGVSALPRVPTAIVPVEVELTVGDVLVLGTDGFADPLGDGTGTVGELFATGLAGPPTLPGLAWLLDFDSAAHDDDRTVLAVWPVATDAANVEP
ncbi:protein phosphatase 2C domain-containing protein [Micromonospora sp. NBC_01699]|uniref:protein phosphatase 2C domain-containing protein n=1 Tax=Micromonospora sp. NBC_01699 TaxID=2975984 RepID=UPI002E3238B2|nr:protein phosphatase 2C domain-containing protein [Micromonospora sp. NBC_01699]